MSIDELVAKYSKIPGDIRISSKTYTHPGAWFTPYFKAENGDWHGVSQENIHLIYGSDMSDCQIYKKPKKKIRLYQWAYKTKDRSWDSTSYFYPTLEKATKFAEDMVDCDEKITKMIRLDHTMIEVEEE